MPISQVFFRGPTLTIVRKGVVEEIRIPDAMRSLPGGNHVDHTPARKHLAGMLIVTGPFGSATLVKDIPLRGKRVVFTGTTTGPCSAGANLDQSVALNAITDKGKTGAATLRPTASGTRIKLGDGALENDMSHVTNFVYNIPDDDASKPTPPHHLPLLKVWTPTAGPVTIELTDASGGPATTIPLTDDQSVYVYNWDINPPGPPAPPTPDEYSDFPPKECDENNKVDLDFKWLYQELDVQNNDWKTWLHGKPLPCPITDCTQQPHIVTPGGSDCIDAVWWKE